MDSKWFKLAKDSLPPELLNLEKSLNEAKMKNKKSYIKDRQDLMIQAPTLSTDQWAEKASKLREKYKDVLTDDEINLINMGL